MREQVRVGGSRWTVDEVDSEGMLFNDPWHRHGDGADEGGWEQQVFGFC